MRAAVDRRVADLARRQHGAITTAQLHALGLSPAAIAHRVAHAHLRRVHRGVFVVGPLERELTSLAAAVLACGEGATLAGRTAAALWGLLPADADAPIDVLVANRARSRPGIRVRATASLFAGQDVTRHQGLRVATPARTLLDLALTARPAALERAIEQAQILHQVTPSRIDDVLARHRGHRGAARLRSALAHGRKPHLTRSEAERRLLDLIHGAELPEPAANVRIGGIEVDLPWRAQRLVVEVDGVAFHGTAAAFERDRRRDARLTAAGYRVVRLTWPRIVDEPLAVVAELAALLRE